MNSPSAPTEHVSLNLASSFLLDPVYLKYSWTFTRLPPATAIFSHSTHMEKEDAQNVGWEITHPNRRFIQGCTKRTFPVVFCLPTPGRRMQFFHPIFTQPVKRLLVHPCTSPPELSLLTTPITPFGVTDGRRRFAFYTIVNSSPHFFSLRRSFSDL